MRDSVPADGCSCGHAGVGNHDGCPCKPTAKADGQTAHVIERQGQQPVVSRGQRDILIRTSSAVQMIADGVDTPLRLPGRSRRENNCCRPIRLVLNGLLRRCRPIAREHMVRCYAIHRGGACHVAFAGNHAVAYCSLNAVYGSRWRQACAQGDGNMTRPDGSSEKGDKLNPTREIHRDARTWRIVLLAQALRRCTHHAIKGGITPRARRRHNSWRVGMG